MTTRGMLFKTLVKPFYKENAALFVFVFIMMFFIINKNDGAEHFEYHYSLTIGILKNWSGLLLVLFAWTVYIRKYVIYVSYNMKQPAFTYLQILNSTPRFKRFAAFFILEIWLSLPILLYAIFILAIGLWKNFYLPVFLVVLFLLLSNIVAACLHVRQVESIGVTNFSSDKKILFKKPISSYLAFLVGFMINQQRLIWLAFKFFTCGILYLIARNNTEGSYEIKTVYLFFSFGILAQSILVQRVRSFEETCLSFYRGLPVMKSKKLFQYAAFYGLLLFPEFLAICFLTPVWIHYNDAAGFLLCSFSLILLVHSFTFVSYTTEKEFLKLVSLLFFVQYFCIMSFGFFLLFSILLLLAVIIFYKSYFKFERIK